MKKHNRFNPDELVFFYDISFKSESSRVLMGLLFIIVLEMMVLY